MRRYLVKIGLVLFGLLVGSYFTIPAFADTINSLPQYIISKDEGTQLTARTSSLNFTGSGVTATNTGNAVTVNITGGGGGGGTPGGSDTQLQYNNAGSFDGIANSVVSGGSIGLGGTPDATAILDLQSTTQGFLPPRMTTVQRDAISASAPSGLTIFNTDANGYQFHFGSGYWVPLLDGGLIYGEGNIPYVSSNGALMTNANSFAGVFQIEPTVNGLNQLTNGLIMENIPLNIIFDSGHGIPSGANAFAITSDGANVIKIDANKVITAGGYGAGSITGTPTYGLAVNSSGKFIEVALGSGLTVGTTGITSGTSGRFLYNNAGVLGEYEMPLSSTLGGTGVAQASASSTLTLSGAFGLTLTQTGTTNVTLPTSGRLATLTGTETLTNKTVTDSTFTVLSSTGTNRKFVIDASAISDSSTMTLAFAASSGGKTITFPNSTGTLSLRGINETIAGLKTMTALNVITHSSVGLLVRNPADTFSYTITGAAIAADRTLNLPLITGTDTLASLGLAQTFTATTSFSSDVQRTGGTVWNLGGNTISSLRYVAGFITGNSQSYWAYGNTTAVTPFVFSGTSNSTLGAIGTALDSTNGIVLWANNATNAHPVARGGINITNLVNTSGVESGDMIFSTKPATATTGLTEWLRLTSDGRFYGTALHNNAGAVTGATNQYIASGTYTPTLTNTTNVAASTARLASWTRVGNVVTVAGQVDIDPTAVGATLLGVSLPIASALTTAYQLGGAASTTTVANESYGIEADATNDRASFKNVAVDVTNHTVTYTFTYEVL